MCIGRFALFSELRLVVTLAATAGVAEPTGPVCRLGGPAERARGPGLAFQSLSLERMAFTTGSLRPGSPERRRWSLA